MKQNINSISKSAESKKPFHLNKKWNFVWVVLYLTGLLLGFGFNTLATIADMEGTSFWGDFQDAIDYNHDLPAQAELVNLRCPILISPTEEGIITAVLRNNLKNKKDILVKAVVSDGDFQSYREINGSLPISTNIQEFQWKINHQDVVEGNFILSRVFLMNADHQTPIPARTNACGVFVLGFLGLTGFTMMTLIISATIIFLLGGCILLGKSDSRLKKTKPRVDSGLFILTGIILFGLLAALLGSGILSGISLLLTILLGSILLTSILMLKR